MSKFPEETGSELLKFYGFPGENLKRLKFPYQMYYNGKKCSSTRVHEKVYDSLLRIYNNVLAAYGTDKIKELGLDQFAGCFNIRKMRGGTKMSTHSWGIAIDHDHKNNTLRMKKPQARFSKEEYDVWWWIWEQEGWYSLGREHNYDWMHIQACWRNKP